MTLDMFRKDGRPLKTCPNCNEFGTVTGTFGWRRMPSKRDPQRRVPQSWCYACRARGRQHAR